MNTTIKTKNEAMTVYEAFFDSYLQGDMKTMASLLDNNCEIIGSTEGEIFNNKSETMKYYEATADQIAGKAELRNRNKREESVDGLVLITEVSDLYILIEKEWTFYSKVRLSSRLKKSKDGWKFIQNHSSIPDVKAQEGEQLAVEKIKNENLELRDAVKRRTVELEHKNRELEIEAALERVRSTAMAMHSSDDLALTVDVFFKELKNLQVTPRRCGVTLIDEESCVADLTVTTATSQNEDQKMTGKLKLTGHPILDSVYENWKRQKEYHPVIKGDQIKQYYEVMNPQIEYPDFPDDDSALAHAYLSTPSGKSLAALHLQIGTGLWIDKAVSHWRKAKTYYEEWDQATFMVWTEKMLEQGMNDFPYDQKTDHLNSGDTILLLSDGLPELLNATGEIYGYEKIKTELQSIGEKKPNDIIIIKFFYKLNRRYDYH